MTQIETVPRLLPTPVDAEELVLIAYMDNELQPKERRVFEKRLCEEPKLRQKLAEFERTWQVLDFLETQETNQEQVYSSLKLIALSAEDDAKTQLVQQRKTNTGRSFVFWCFMLGLAFLGFQIVDRFYHVYETSEINDLLLIERLDQYLLLDETTNTAIDEIEFLRRLHESKILD